MDVRHQPSAQRRSQHWQRWFLPDIGQLRHHTQLLCLPHAGGFGSTYRDWLRDLSADVDVIPAVLPGRERRAREPCPAAMDDLIADLTEAIRLAGLRNLALFGHSLGAVLAIKLCESLERIGLPVRHVFVSGHPGPGQIPLRNTLAMAWADDELLLAAMNGLTDSQAVRPADAELRAVSLRLIRQDLRLLATCDLRTDLVTAPVTVIGGINDPLLAGEDLGAWAALTRGGCEVRWLEGDHFYLASQPAALARVVRERLASLAPTEG